MRLAIGDVHGHPFWKNYIGEDCAEFFFVGDYFDTHDGAMNFKKQYENFAGICGAARENSRIKLCIGNHDYHYLRGIRDERYSGFQHGHAEKIRRALEANIDLLNVVYVSGDFLVSHAGVTNHFMRSLGLSEPKEINDAFHRDRTILRFNGEDMYGDDVTQSPIWIRPASLCTDPLDGYSQIAGHTPVRKISEFEIHGGKNKIVFIDTYDTESIYRF